MVHEPTPNETASEPRKPRSIESADEYRSLLADNELVLLEFVTSGCGICASMEPVLGTVARVTPATVGVLDAADVPELTTEYTIRSVPTLVVLRDGEEVARLADGFQGAETLVNLVESAA